ncbi:BREX-1 system adenine-specific DNA-methyltransferase PglX [Levilactobacillus brevis]|nr:BREX-1 system adenine-specific DNA-methyltransferase PglX [Levilactobacillus brevis]
MIHDISEDDFNVAVGGQVEIIGWLYQYYNSEPKDLAFKKKKYLEVDIPAVTQLFTPDWIVKYMVENSLGRYWIHVVQAKGDSRSEQQLAEYFGWKYFMPEAQETGNVNVTSEAQQLSEVTIEDITLVDLAMGSGHILIYAFDVFMQIYEQEGYARREATNRIIQNNLYGLDIDTRAFQLAYFSLMMKGRANSRRFLTQNIRPNVYDIPETGSLTSDDFQSLLQSDSDIDQLNYVLDSFRYGNEYGSLIHFDKPIDWHVIDRIANEKLPVGQLTLDAVSLAENQHQLQEISAVGKVLSNQYSIGAMNPPYMGTGKMDAILGKYVKQQFSDSKSDLFAVFMERLRSLIVPNGYYAMITQHSWMFLSSFEKLRKKLRTNTLINMAHLGTRAFEEIGGEVVQSTAFVYQQRNNVNYIGTFERLVDFDSQQRKEKAYLATITDPSVDYLYRTNQAKFEMIPGYKISYWISDKTLASFQYSPIKNFGIVKSGIMVPSSFVRCWFEVSKDNIQFNSTTLDDMQGYKWFPLNSGGGFKKWYGNNLNIVNLENEGEEIKKSNKNYRLRDSSFYFKAGITWGE